MTEKQESVSPEFITLDEAADMTSGTRVTFVPGVQAMYSEALKNICFVKKVSLIRVLHPPMGVDETTGKNRQAKLYELTSQTSLPTMLHDKERPRNVWIEQLALAEQIGAADSPALIPDNFELRVEMLGRKYGYSKEASSAAPGKIAEVITLIDNRLEAQEKRGSRYLVGDALTAADIYWATMSMTVLPAPPEIMPQTQQNKGMLIFFESNSKIPVIEEALTKRIEDHQQFILTTYCETPAVLGGDPL